MSRGWYLIGLLGLLFLANAAMLLGLTNWPQRTREGFMAQLTSADADVDGLDNVAPYKGSKSLEQGASFRFQQNEGFVDYLVDGGFGTAPIGSYDGMNMAAGLPPDAQGFRARMPNVPHPPGTEMLPFVNNVCKPECCGSTMSCDGGGCICTTPEDRDLINTRGGNRRHEAGF